MEEQDLEEFVQDAALDQARQVLLERSIISMDNKERDAFLALLEYDPEPTKAALNSNIASKTQYQPIPKSWHSHPSSNTAEACVPRAGPESPSAPRTL